MIESLLCCLQLDLERIERGAGIYVIDGFEKNFLDLEKCLCISEHQKFTRVLSELEFGSKIKI